MELVFSSAVNLLCCVSVSLEELSLFPCVNRTVLDDSDSSSHHHFLSLLYFQYFPLKPCEELDLLHILFSFKYEVLKHIFIRLTKDPWETLMITFAMEPFLCSHKHAVNFSTFKPPPLAHLWQLLFSLYSGKKTPVWLCF